MIDLALLREDTQRVLALIKKKDPKFDGQRLFELDQQVRQLKMSVEELRNSKNELAKLGQSGVTAELRERSQVLSKELKEREEELAQIQEEFNYVYLRCPNLLMEDIPEGGKESNTVIKTVGEQPIFNFDPKNHAELGKQLGWFDFEAAVRMTGNNFALYKGDAVKLMYALSIFMLNNNMKYGYSPVLPPYLVNEKALEGASNFPRFKDEVYAVTADKLFLTPTAEVNLANMYRDTILTQEELPVRMTAWTSCFRREAGGYGATERGLIRIHQFEKVELYTISTPQESAQELERMIACAENILQSLGLHYRISLLAAQDCSFASAKTYDIEVWMPGQKEYKEVSSSSNCTDFQSRRCALRYRAQQGAKPQLAHTLNASSLALPRLVVALMETYQQEDGSLALPDVLKSVCIGI